MRYRPHLYLVKADLLGHLRDSHCLWWSRYEDIYEKGTHLVASKTSSNGVDYSNVAKEMLTRCRMYDNLFNSLLGFDLLQVNDFGNYCKRVFQEINKLKPAFPDSPASVGVFDATVREFRKFVMKQNAELEVLAERFAARAEAG